MPEVTSGAWTRFSIPHHEQKPLLSQLLAGISLGSAQVDHLLGRLLMEGVVDASEIVLTQQLACHFVSLPAGLHRDFVLELMRECEWGCNLEETRRRPLFWRIYPCAVWLILSSFESEWTAIRHWPVYSIHSKTRD